MTSIIIFAPVLFYRLLIFRSFFALGGQLIILHGNDNGIAFFYLICQDHLGCQGLHVLLDITLQRPCTVDRIISIVHDILHSFLRQTDGQLLILQTSVQIGNDQMNDAADIVLGQRLEQDCRFKNSGRKCARRSFMTAASASGLMVPSSLIPSNR